MNLQLVQVQNKQKNSCVVSLLYFWNSDPPVKFYMFMNYRELEISIRFSLRIHVPLLIQERRP